MLPKTKLTRLIIPPSSFQLKRNTYYGTLGKQQEGIRQNSNKARYSSS